MDAWEKLTAGSTIEIGDAWEHLLAQGGGGGDVYIGSVLSADVVTSTSADVTSPILEAVIETALTVNVSTVQATAGINTTHEAII